MEYFPQLAFERDQQLKVPSPLDEVVAVVPSKDYFYEFTRIISRPI
jgi:hypothetical protein